MIIIDWYEHVYPAVISALVLEESRDNINEPAVAEPLPVWSQQHGGTGLWSASLMPPTVIVNMAKKEAPYGTLIFC